MKKLLLLLTLLSCVTQIKAQNKLTKSQERQLKNPDDSYDSNNNFTLKKGEKNIYENQGNYHSSHYYINPDKTFVYYSVFEGGYEMCFGTWVKHALRITFNWDSLQTYKAIHDTSIYYKYYRYCTPQAVKLADKTFLFHPWVLIPTE